MVGVEFIWCGCLFYLLYWLAIYLGNWVTVSCNVAESIWELVQVKYCYIPGIEWVNGAGVNLVS